MYRLEVTGDQLRESIQAALHPFAQALVKIAAGCPRPTFSQRAATTSHVVSALKEWLEEYRKDVPAKRAIALLSWLVDAASPDRDGPLLLGYGTAWKLILFEEPCPKNKGPNAFNPVIEMAMGTPQQELKGFGPVRLDTFIVNERKKKPGEGHWKTAQYDEEDWHRTFGRATLIKARDIPG